MIDKLILLLIIRLLPITKINYVPIHMPWIDEYYQSANYSKSK